MTSRGWWQRDDLCYRQDSLHFADHCVSDLARQLPSPCFIYSGKRVTDNLQRIKKALASHGFDQQHGLFYAMKANRFAPLLTYLKTTGLCGIDACAPNEVTHAVSCGFQPNEISLTATSLSRQDFETLAGYEGLIINCDSLHSIRSWGKLKPGSEIGIRINPAMGTGRADNEKLQYAGDQITKFGIYREQFAEALALAASYRLTVTRIHLHTGCGYLNQQLPQWQKVLEQSLWFIEQVLSVEAVNIGGGLGVPHLATDQPLNLDNWAKTLAKVMGGKPWRIEIEPGEYLAKDAGLLILEKTFIEQKKDQWFVGVNGGFNLAPEPAHYGMPFLPVALLNTPETRRVSVVGNINEALDVWYADIDLPCLEDQPYLALINAGAYSASMASNHCMRGAVNEFLIL
ncbi:MAG: hypothetical protein P1U54_02960 [Immundisolibacteraceae bacterium]|nr:hypothetical protein [Immundisolibacteraceae bacterium]